MIRRSVLIPLVQLFVLFGAVIVDGQSVASAAHITTIVVTSAVGSRTDYATRVFARELERYLGESIVVINIKPPGGYQKVVGAAPDGKTLTVYTPSSKKYGVTVGQFAPVAVFAKGCGLVAPKNTPQTIINRLEQATRLVTSSSSFKMSLMRLQLETPFIGSQGFPSEVRNW